MQIWDFTTERNTYLFTLQITFYGVVRNVASMVENDYGGTCLVGKISLKIVRVFFRILSPPFHNFTKKQVKIQCSLVNVVLFARNLKVF